MKTIRTRHLAKRLAAWAAATLSTIVLPAEGALVPVTQVSDPTGFVSQTDVVGTGNSFTTIQPGLSLNGYVFGYWTAGNTRLADAGDRQRNFLCVARRHRLAFSAVRLSALEYDLSVVRCVTGRLRLRAD